MSKTLVIVESPAKAKSISKFLGRKYTVKASMGHVRDLPKSQFGVDVENDFEPKYITIRGKGEVLKELRGEAKKAKEILLATDPDREGEAIAWHLQTALKIDEEKECRIEFNEITKNAVKQSVQAPRCVDKDRVDAQQARRIVDRLVGYNLSPLLWRKVKKGLSAGRVQSVAVKLICDREEEIQEFVPEEYWSLEATLKVKGTELLTKLAKHKGKKVEIKNEQEMKQIIEDIKAEKYIVNELTKRERKKNPQPPFTTSTLQQDAYRKLNFTPKKTMRIAQQLYEGIELDKKEGTVGLITYIRTDSKRISSTAQEEATSYIKEKYGQDYVQEKERAYKDKGKKVQDAHEAIRPTYTEKTPDLMKQYLSRDQNRLYRLIWERFIASQMSSAVLINTALDIAAGEYTFRATGSTVKFQGFMKVYTDEDTKKKDVLLPEIDKGTEMDLVKLDPKQHFTQPPARFTEATLVKLLEELGIGRPSTYAPIIDTIQSRGYVVKEEKQLHPTELGGIVNELLKEYFINFLDVDFTASLEEGLDKVEEGELYWKEVVKDYYKPFAQLLDKAEEEIGKIEIEDEVSDEICEKCGKNLVIKMGRYGKFLACPGFPDCSNTKPLLEEVGVSCPECDGQVVIRRSKKGRVFYGCKNYPDCEYISWYQPIEKSCPKCSKRLVTKTTKKKGTRIFCPDSECHYEEEVTEGDFNEK
ncbi:DNA topoisomerase-1 [Desulfitispora alkaliphila]|uniref:type I DNA topoisomerase n=1 Tax=Desulfitispora alkaliphila TaxID=622674 RepID=UPI003D257A79